MISQMCLQAIFDAIKVYNVRQGKKYLIGYRANSNKPFEFCEIILKKENFWHLVGTVISHNKTLDKNLLFEKCLLEDDISKELDYTRRADDVIKKAKVFVKVFDFISNAKELRIAKTDNSPEIAMFNLGAGTIHGVIGYVSTNSGYVPKTTQEKSIFKIDPNANDKINIIISKKIGEDEYSSLEYTISKKSTAEIISQLRCTIPDNIKISDSLQRENS